MGQFFFSWLSYVQTQLDPKYFVDWTIFHFGAPPYCPLQDFGDIGDGEGQAEDKVSVEYEEALSCTCLSSYIS